MSAEFDYWVCDECRTTYRADFVGQLTVKVQQASEFYSTTYREDPVPSRKVLRMTVCERCWRRYQEARSR